AEHGILNWFVAYASNQLGLSMARATTYLSLFFGGITIGRLLFSPWIAKLGIQKSIQLFGGVATVFYCVGLILGIKGIWLFSLAGVFFSILYPTLIMMIQSYYERDIVSTATGCIISAATIFDILFNSIFGYLVDSIGFAKGFLILPIAMGVFYFLFTVFNKRVSVLGEKSIENN
ncbi:MAG: hypothetical protein PWP24_1944, partial [Clostridiales bacterium]|nr:hypothetical protein [Clostridiales bacterium]